MSTIPASKTAAPATIVAGEQAQPVSVQSQLASKTIDGQVTSKSNLGSIVGDLGAAHTAHAGWLESETQKITQWGTGEIARLMNATKGIEEKLVAEAQLKQKALDESHKVELAKMVQQLDAKKAMQLKELEDGLQRQIQAALNTTKQDINNIESEMNKRKMALMQQAQEQTAKDVSRLANLSVEAKLIPSTTRTVIETNTNTGTVLAVAAGGAIKTGGVAESVVATDKIVAAPMAGTVLQDTAVTAKKNGDGVIMSTKTDVQQHSNQQPIHGALPGPVQARGAPVNTGATIRDESLATGVAGVRIHEDPTESLPVKQHGTGMVDSGLHNKNVDAAYGRSIDNTYDKHAATTDATGHHHKEGLLSKIKHAVTGEPKSTDAHSTRL